MRVAVLVGAMACQLVSAADFRDALDPAIEQVIRAVFDELEAKATACAPGPPYGGVLPVERCGRLPRAVRKAPDLAERFDAAFRAAGAPPASDDEETENGDGPTHAAEAHYVVGKVTLAFSLDPRAGRFLIRYPATFPPCLDADLPSADVEGVEPPVRSSHAYPEFPLEARRQRASGVVQLQAVIGEDGAVGEVCVQFVSREGLGFEQAAIDALRQSRYSPARRDGQPVAVRMTTAVRFEIR